MKAFNNAVYALITFKAKKTPITGMPTSTHPVGIDVQLAIHITYLYDYVLPVSVSTFTHLGSLFPPLETSVVFCPHDKIPL